MNAICAAPELGKPAANRVPLSPISVLERSAQVHSGLVATIRGKARRSRGEAGQRCRRPARSERPKRRVFGELAKTSAGKIRINALRDPAHSTPDSAA